MVQSIRVRDIDRWWGRVGGTNFDSDTLPGPQRSGQRKMEEMEKSAVLSEREERECKRFSHLRWSEVSQYTGDKDFGTEILNDVHYYLSLKGSCTHLYSFIDEVMFAAHAQTLLSLCVMEKYSGTGRAVLLLSGLGRSGNRTMKDKAVSACSVPQLRLCFISLWSLGQTQDSSGYL